MGKMNCAVVHALRWAYFSTGVNPATEEEIINHLLSCEQCRKEYEEYAEEIGWGLFDVVDIAQKFKEKKPDKIQSSWIKRFKNEEVVSLARSKAIRQVMLGEKDLNFTNFLIERICKDLDFLESCYNKEEAQANEKS